MFSYVFHLKLLFCIGFLMFAVQNKCFPYVFNKNNGLAVLVCCFHNIYIHRHVMVAWSVGWKAGWCRGSCL